MNTKLSETTYDARIPANDNNPHKTFALDLERYEPLLCDENIPEEQRKELLQTLWALVCELVLMGWEMHPLQHAENTCGKNAVKSGESTLLTPDMLECEDINLTDNFKREAEPEARSGKRGVSA